MKALILHQSIIKHDAIGNDVFSMYQLLSGTHEPFVYCDHLDMGALKRIDREQLGPIIDDPSNLIIYHHSQYWEEGEGILDRAAAKIVIKYHNITPETFYREFDEDAHHKCRKGREQTRRLTARHPHAFWMGDSLFNLQDLEAVRPEQKAVVPPFHTVEKWTGVVPDDALLRSLLESRHLKVLFVGRVAPNKGHKFMFRVLRDYIDHYGPHIRLTIVGKPYGSRTYEDDMRSELKALRLRKNVHFTGEVTESEMLAYYLGSDFFLCGSEHEGFCIPLIEAQFCHLPVIARNTSAVAETLGPDQLLLTEDIREYSSSLKVLSESGEYKEFLVRKGYENYRRRFTEAALSSTFARVIIGFTGVSL